MFRKFTTALLLGVSLFGSAAKAEVYHQSDVQFKTVRVIPNWKLIDSENNIYLDISNIKSKNGVYENTLKQATNISRFRVDCHSMTFVYIYDIIHREGHKDLFTFHSQDWRPIDALPSDIADVLDRGCM